MPHLSTADYRAVLAVVERAVEVEGTLPFPLPVLEELRRLVPCDVVACHEQPAAGPRVIVYAGTPVGPMTPEIHVATRRYAHQDPLIPADGARKISDYVRPRDYQRLGIYQEADRRLGIEHMMRLWIDPGGVDGARLEFDRSSTDFSERDRTVLNVLLPHLRQLRLRAVARRRAARAPVAKLTTRESEILLLVAEGKTNGEVAQLLQISNGTVRKHLENAYAKLGVHTRTGAVAAVTGLHSGSQ